MIHGTSFSEIRDIPEYGISQTKSRLAKRDSRLSRDRGRWDR